MKNVQTTWNKLVSKGKTLALELNKAEGNLSLLREKIAVVVLQAEEIGGMGKFVKELQKVSPDLKYPTVMTWVQEKRKRDKVDVKLKEVPKKEKESKKGKAAINRALKSNKEGGKNDITLKDFQKEFRKSVEEVELDGHILVSKKVQFFCNEMVLSKLPLEKLEGLHQIISMTVEILEKEFLFKSVIFNREISHATQ